MNEHVLLLGHGSHLNIHSSTPVHRQVERLRNTGRHRSVHAAFWKEEPSFARALDRYDEGDVVTVPMFVSGGFFTGEVIPAEMQLAGRVTRRERLTVRLADPVGGHPDVAKVIVSRARAAGAGPASGVAVLGHGTQRNPDSAANILSQTQRVERMSLFAQVAAVFLEQEPHLSRVHENFSTKDIFIVPLFMAEGWHVDESIPPILEPGKAETAAGKASIRYAGAVGTHQDMSAMVEACVEEALRW